MDYTTPILIDNLIDTSAINDLSGTRSVTGSLHRSSQKVLDPSAADESCRHYNQTVGARSYLSDDPRNVIGLTGAAFCIVVMVAGIVGNTMVLLVIAK